MTLSLRQSSKGGGGDNNVVTGKNLMRAMILLGTASLVINVRYFVYSNMNVAESPSSFGGSGNNKNDEKSSWWNTVQEVLPLVGRKVKKTLQGEVKGGQFVKKDRRGRAVVKQITALSANDLGGLGGDDRVVGEGELTLEEAMKGREPIIQSLREAGIQDFDAATVSKLPLWSQIEKLYGKGPVVHGLDTCDTFKNSVPPQDWSMASAGIFNSGTNTLAMYMNANCHIPQNKKEKYGGMRWQVPWG
jgi:hypothetical protein